MSRPLPEPGRERWQPQRAGLVDLFYYDIEEFWFRDGRLLLRGNNGTGKSKVLALMLPFLLDGELSPHRVEPDGDPKKRMEWNLLLGGAHPHPERLGYTWLEFGRRREDGSCEYRTLGCGLKAVSGRGIARHWFFVTTQRVGPELALVDATRTALTRDRLAEALGAHGTVHERARDYRRMVDEALFGFGAARYSALVDLLVQLRQPQLSKRPNEAALSHALTQALPPLDQAIVSDVAEAFRSLEEDRDAVAVMDEAHRAAESFLGHYRRYARVASRRRAELPRAAQSNYERVGRELGEAQAGYDAAHQEVEVAAAQLVELERTRVQLQARDRTLREGPEMRSAVELERAAVAARERSAAAARLDEERAEADAMVEGRRRRQTGMQEKVERTKQRLTAARQASTDAAANARIDIRHATDVDALLDAIGSDDDRPQRAATELADRQQRAIIHVSTLFDAKQRATAALATARGHAEDLAAEADQLTEQRREAEAAAVRRGSELVAATGVHLDGARELAVEDRAAVLAALELWVETLDGPNPARVTVTAAGRTAATALARADAALRTEQLASEEQREQLIEVTKRLEAGEDTAPPAPHTRDPRDGRDGAPLWQLVDFTDEVTVADRAGLEAALEAAGILDAWVSSDGQLLAAGTHDVLLGAGTPVAGNLTEVLRPAVDPADPRAAMINDGSLRDLLASIGLGAAGGGDTWVDVTGRFRLAVLDGSWSKSDAAYIGRGAREAARRARLAALRAELVTVEADLTRLRVARAELVARGDTLTAELESIPDDGQLRAAHADVTALVVQRNKLLERQRRAELRLESATRIAQGAADDLAAGAAELRLPDDADGLAAVRDGLAEYRLTLAALWPALEQGRDAQRQLDDAAAELADAEATLVRRTELALEARPLADAATERHRTLADTVGAAVAELQRRLDEVAEGFRRHDEARRVTETRRTAALTERGKAEGRREELRRQLATATEERASAADALRRFARTGLLTVALPELTVPDPAQQWAPDPTVRLARQVDQQLAEVAADDHASERAQRRVAEELKILADTLSLHGNSASARLLDDGVVVDVVFQGRPSTVPELETALAAEVTERQRLLDEREREILENHLINEVASTLQELISAAEAQVTQMNGELDSRPTSTGMRLRLGWRTREDGPAGLAAARERLLRQTSDAWSPDDRTAVGEFLQARIAEVRAVEPTGTWLEHLTEALDYRSWHRFVIQRHQNGQWRSATGPASGGERVLAASVPLFAAASAHYASAGNPHAPRLVTLDEAFAGVDDNARAKYLGLLAAFDLDVVMTSEREWGCYPEVPGLAIAQLSRTEDVAAVLVTGWEWDGRRKVQVARPAPDIPTGYDAVSEPVAQDGLWN
jgi:uncharacterized protein (TIGR02680 family)